MADTSPPSAEREARLTGKQIERDDGHRDAVSCTLARNRGRDFVCNGLDVCGGIARFVGNTESAAEVELGNFSLCAECCMQGDQARG